MGALQIYIVVVDDDDDDVLRVSTAFHFAIKNDFGLAFSCPAFSVYSKRIL